MYMALYVHACALHGVCVIVAWSGDLPAEGCGQSGIQKTSGNGDTCSSFPLLLAHSQPIPWALIKFLFLSWPNATAILHAMF